MNPKVSVFIATSLDGFIARKNGELDGLNDANATVPEGADCGYRAFMDSIDTFGSIVKPIFPFPGGRRFHFSDPNGNEYAVWSDLTP